MQTGRQTCNEGINSAYNTNSNFFFLLDATIKSTPTIRSDKTMTPTKAEIMTAQKSKMARF